MNAFEKLMDDIFKVDDFLEECKVNNKENETEYKCIVSPIVDNISFDDAGMVSEENFTLDIKLPINEKIEIGNYVTFRNKEYKIGYIETDSANTSIKLHIIALSKGIG